ncbi:unnamed protein product, partial [marine sediment metagenome]
MKIFYINQMMWSFFAIVIFMDKLMNNKFTIYPRLLALIIIGVWAGFTLYNMGAEINNNLE